MRYEILTIIIIVLGLVLFVCQSAQSLETGYGYPTNVSVAEHILHKDLKCTFLFGGLTHLLVIRHLFDDPLYLNMQPTVGRVISYSRILKCQIDSLYRLKIMRMGALWLLHLYMGMLYSFYDKSSNKEEDGRKIMATHDYVIDKLRGDLTDCRPGSSLDSYEMLISSIPDPSRSELTHLMDHNIAEAKGLLMKNNICGQPYKEYVGNTLQIGSLLLNNLGVNDFFKEDLMVVFNAQVEWNGTGELLTSSWYNARNLFFSTEKFEYIKLYYELNFNFLKIIIFRLSLKHVYFLEKNFKKSIHYEIFAKEWCKKVKDFGDMLSLSEDLHVKNLLNCFKNFVNKEQTIQSVVSYLMDTLGSLCQPLGCVATNDFDLNGKELQIPFKSLTKTEVENLNITKKPLRIDYHSLENTRVFLDYLRCVFKNVDFNLIRLLVEYINEVEP